MSFSTKDGITSGDKSEPASPRRLGVSPLQLLYHLTCAAVFVRVWVWHTGPDARGLPGAIGFGWFFRYLTFCSFTLQTGLFVACSVVPLTKNAARRARLERAVDTWACALFPLANTVTILFYAIQASTGALVEGTRDGTTRPDWLNFAVHGANSIAAWGDVAVSRDRSFSGSSRLLAVALGLAYAAWSAVIRVACGKYPYPILNKLPVTTGFPAFFGLGIVVLLTIHAVGSTFRRLRSHVGAAGRQQLLKAAATRRERAAQRAERAERRALERASRRAVADEARLRRRAVDGHRALA